MSDICNVCLHAGQMDTHWQRDGEEKAAKGKFNSMDGYDQTSLQAAFVCFHPQEMNHLQQCWVSTLIWNATGAWVCFFLYVQCGNCSSDLKLMSPKTVHVQITRCLVGRVWCRLFLPRAAHHFLPVTAREDLQTWLGVGRMGGSACFPTSPLFRDLKSSRCCAEMFHHYWQNPGVGNVGHFVLRCFHSSSDLL